MPDQAMFNTRNATVQEIGEGLGKRTLVKTDTLAVDEFYFDQGIEGGGHAHDIDEAAFIVAGRFEVDLGGEVQTVEPGDSYSLPAGIEHKVRCIDRGSYVVIKALTSGP